VLLQPIVLTEVEGGTLVTDAGSVGEYTLLHVIFVGSGLGVGLHSSSHESFSTSALTTTGTDHHIKKRPSKIKTNGILRITHAAVSPRY